MLAIGGAVIMKLTINLNAIMSDTTLSQAVNRLDRMEEITYANTVGIQELQQSIAQVTQLQDRSNRRHQQHDLELDDHDERVERLERDHLEHSTRMAKLEEIQADIKSMLELLVRRSIGE